MRFAVVSTNQPGLSRWEIHTPECPDVHVWMHKGAFVEIVSANSPEALVHRELILWANAVCSKEDFQIMPCCEISKVHPTS
jgi:hypothetical protein